MGWGLGQGYSGGAKGIGRLRRVWESFERGLEWRGERVWRRRRGGRVRGKGFDAA